MANELILIVDDEAGMRQYLKKLLEDNNYQTQEAADGQKAIDLISAKAPDLVLADLKMPKVDGLKLLSLIKKGYPDLAVIIMTAYGSMESAISAMKLGAYDYINKPFDMDEILISIDKALEKKRLEAENIALHKQLEQTYTFEDIISQNQQMKKIFELVKKIADTKSTILIQGETGTGKELIARAIHNLSSRCKKPFIPVDCGALTETLLESELFGHIKGAFTGATSDKQGLFEIAEGGSVFLDEIGKVSLNIQAKLLRVLQDNQIKRVGEASSRKVDIRLISASNEDLQDLVQKGSFREDLFYRLNVVLLSLPPLRERKEDIPLLVSHFIEKYRALEKKSLTGISQDALNILMKYNWPGNVRELENLIHRAVVMEADAIIMPKDLPSSLKLSDSAEERHAQKRSFNFKKARKQAIEAFEKRFLIEALKLHDGNISRTAKEIGLDRRNFQRKCKEFKIKPQDYRD
ncbi:MAG: sigma-54-dependent Fis family transcriptional regulator [Candidatus Omnitrophica bacterium]|nr:sigma-54-dependent Fis family transcriptional regulator [Candidatus Omnitrophota bacterium]